MSTLIPLCPHYYNSKYKTPIIDNRIPEFPDPSTSGVAMLFSMANTRVDCVTIDLVASF